MSDVVESFAVGPLRVRIFPANERDVFLVLVYDEGDWPDDDTDGETITGLDAAIARGHELAGRVLAKRAARDKPLT